MALAKRLAIPREKATKYAHKIMDYFGYDERIIDNLLDQKDRQLFYLLEAEGVLTTEREETRLYDGRPWRTHYWRLNKGLILHYARGIVTRATQAYYEEKEDQPVEQKTVYSGLSNDIWYTRKSPYP